MGTGAGAEAHHSHWGPNLDPRCSIILLRPHDVQDAREIVCEHGCREVWTDVKSRLGATAGYHPQDIKPGQLGYSRWMPSSREAALMPP